MPSIIPGFNYDIFISYRQKDNKHDGWVTEFVNNLMGELESTFKEEINVYFDINPHDGLLETHDVDASLKEKLKCLVFIPIISRTYCDPKSFAWEHELKPFVEMALGDGLGMKIRLPNGNVANRILPIQIHDLDSEDKSLIEHELGGIIRPIEFIYKEPGVNRPLTPEDEEKKNLNNTRYRNQINKTAIAIKEIISGIKTAAKLPTDREIADSKPVIPVLKEEKRLEKVRPSGSVNTKLLKALGILVILIIAGIYFYPKVFSRDTLKGMRAKGKISVAVMPFQNMTKDSTLNDLQLVIQNVLINSLSQSEDLAVRQTETINLLLNSKGIKNYANLLPSTARSFSLKLEADIFIMGTIIQSGKTLRLNAQLIDSKSEKTIGSFQKEGAMEEGKILPLMDSLSRQIRDFLVLSEMKNADLFGNTFSISTSSPEAYKNYIMGQNYFMKRDYKSAVLSYSKALEIDSDFYMAASALSVSYGNQGLVVQAKQYSKKAYEKIDKIPLPQKLFVLTTYSIYFGTPYDEIKYVKDMLEYDDQTPLWNYQLGQSYSSVFEYEKAIPPLEKSIEIIERLNLKALWVYNYTMLGRAYRQTGKLRKEENLYKKAETIFPDDPELLSSLAIFAFSKGDTARANEYISRYKSAYRETGASAAMVENGVAFIYSESGLLDKAEAAYRRAPVLSPKNPYWKANLVFFLIDKERNIGEGLAISDTLLKTDPENFNYLYSKGWALYKQGKPVEALPILQKSWDLRKLNSRYSHQAYLNLEEVKKAVAAQK